MIPVTCCHVLAAPHTQPELLLLAVDEVYFLCYTLRPVFHRIDLNQTRDARTLSRCALIRSLR